MLEKLAGLLVELGFDASPGDLLLEAALENAKQIVLNETNLLAIPPGLELLTLRMAAGDYLRAKKGAGTLLGYEDAAVKQVQEGDTNIVYGISPEQRLDGLIATLSARDEAQLAAYRRVKW